MREICTYEGRRAREGQEVDRDENTNATIGIVVPAQMRRTRRGAGARTPRGDGLSPKRPTTKNIWHGHWNPASRSTVRKVARTRARSVAFLPRLYVRGHSRPCPSWQAVREGSPRETARSGLRHRDRHHHDLGYPIWHRVVPVSLRRFFILHATHTPLSGQVERSLG